MRGDYRWGGHALVDLSASPGTRFDLRGSGSFAAGKFHRDDAGVVFGLDLIGLVAFGADRRPYLGLGLGYSQNSLSALQPAVNALGVTAAAGYEWRTQTATWFVDARLRTFGNVFAKYASTQTVFLLSLGRPLG